ncbi:hypothetical protein [Clostridium saccharobutylicum]|nr:hypothetical protein [Clostridium saccharobutylicum]MBA2906881.1 hypothetical protein [Clostridium saccharobutylicum]MBA8898183.1 hypothetical protein [Clostridium saccharobutylicum]MBA8980555.1 hypothetical protein [Clostridium saccharobutylicum]MBA8998853.1 hypothetical protein [Clostridium saccharobutylicum]MBA9010311.1 hypothetical protein [Clostridium saccharobutylicum]
MTETNLENVHCFKDTEELECGSKIIAVFVLFPIKVHLLNLILESLRILIISSEFENVTFSIMISLHISRRPDNSQLLPIILEVLPMIRGEVNL